MTEKAELLACLESLFAGVPKSKKFGYLGEFNQLALFIEEHAKTELPK